MSAQPMCIECGETSGIVQRVAIAWPNGHHRELWLHPDCERDCLERLEREQTNKHGSNK
jgi:hypothetical protein